jgi:hypothetical protein
LTAGSVVVEKVEYGGWKNCYCISDASVELIVVAEIGPRILRYGFIGGQNLFVEFPDQLGKSGEDAFQARGGHRLWKAPEDLDTTWIPDNAPVEIRVNSGGLIARSSVEPASGLIKEIEVEMTSQGSVKVVHRIWNGSDQPLTLAPWALTMMARGGIALVKFPPRAPYPENLEPTNPLVMWAYTDLSDKRLTLTQKYLLLRQDPADTAPQKLGLFNEHTWACYLLNGELFIKYAHCPRSATYPDFGCSFETFTNGDFLELETLGPLCNMLSGSSVEHVERWALRRDVDLDDLTGGTIELPFTTGKEM